MHFHRIDVGRNSHPASMRSGCFIKDDQIEASTADAEPGQQQHDAGCKHQELQRALSMRHALPHEVAQRLRLVDYHSWVEAYKFCDDVGSHVPVATRRSHHQVPEGGPLSWPAQDVQRRARVRRRQGGGVGMLGAAA